MMLEKILGMIEKYNMLQIGDGVVVGLSGGPDSTCLLHVLHNIRHRYGLKLYAVHLNHMIREGEAQRDEEFSKEFAQKLEIPFYSKRIDVNAYAEENGLSSEEAGRLLRYDFFETVAKQNGANKIALAHNMNDQTETMLMRLFRGTGASGIVGIRPMRENRFIRPILCCRRDEIEEYCAYNKLHPVIDSTNAQSIYTRNRIRLEVVPYIREHFNPNVDESFFKLSGIIRDEDDYMNMAAQNELERLVSEKGISCDGFSMLHKAIQRRIIRILIEQTKGDLVGIESKHIDDVVDFAGKSGTGKRIMLPQNIECSVEYAHFLIQKSSESCICDYNHRLKIPGYTQIELKTGEKYTIITKIFELNNKNLIDKQFVKYFDYDKIKDVLYFRNRRDGDYISPKGMTGTKKLKEIFIDKKIPKTTRDKTPLIARNDSFDSNNDSGGGEIVWILNMRDSKNYKIDDTTQNVLEIRIIRGEINE